MHEGAINTVGSKMAASTYVVDNFPINLTDGAVPSRFTIYVFNLQIFLVFEEFFPHVEKKPWRRCLSKKNHNTSNQQTEHVFNDHSIWVCRNGVWNVATAFPFGWKNAPFGSIYPTVQLSQYRGIYWTILFRNSLKPTLLIVSPNMTYLSMSFYSPLWSGEKSKLKTLTSSLNITPTDTE